MEFTDAPLEPFGKQILAITVPTQLSYKTPLVYRIVKELAAKGQLPWTGSHRAELCMDEAITNAMIHGNKQDAQKNIHVIVCGDAERWGVIIEDEGEGFGPDQVPDPNDMESLFRETGRGILLMDAYLDKLQYSRKGNRLMMTHARQSEPDEVEAMAALGAEDGAQARETSDILTVSEESGIQIVHIQPARLDDNNVAELKEQFVAVVENGHEIVLDLGRTEYVSSVGLSALVSLFKRVQGKSGHLILTAMQASVSDILESAYLLKLFKSAPDQEQAVAELKKLILPPAPDV